MGNPSLWNPLPMFRVGCVDDYEFSCFSSDGECEKVPLAVICGSEDLFVCCVEILHCSFSKERLGVHCLPVVPDNYPLVIVDQESVEDSANRSSYLL